MTSGRQMTIRRESVVPAGAPFVGVDQLLYNETDGGLYVKLPDGQVRRVNVPPSDARVSAGDARGADAVDFQYTRARADQVASGARSAILGGQNNRTGGADSIALGGSGVDVQGARAVGAGDRLVNGGDDSLVVGHGIGSGGDFGLTVGRWIRNGSGVDEVGGYVKATRVLTWIVSEEQGATLTDAGFMNKGVFIFSSDAEVYRRVELDSVDVANQTMTLKAGGDYTDFEDAMEADPDLFSLYMLDGPEHFNILLGSDIDVLGASNCVMIGEQHEGSAGVEYGFLHGQKGKLFITGEHAYANGQHFGRGSAQYSFFVLRGATTNATPKYIGVNASGRLVLEDKRMVSFKGMVVARTYTGDVNAVWFFRGAIKRGEGVGTVALLGVPIKEVYHKDAGAATWDIDVKADVTNGALEVEVTGQASTGIYWTSHVEWIKTTSQ